MILSGLLNAIDLKIENLVEHGGLPNITSFILKFWLKFPVYIRKKSASYNIFHNFLLKKFLQKNFKNIEKNCSYILSHN